MIVLPPLAVAALSTLALLLLLAHRRANLGGRATVIFVVAAAAYGWLRSIAIGRLSATALADAPYRIVTPLASVGGVPLQELVGWVAAVALAGYLADRLLRRFGRPADAWSTALVAGVAMAAICLAVESAAVTAGWWSWSLQHSATGVLRFPAIALLDWGFVAFDFLLPFELWRRRAPMAQRVLGLLLFPLHLAGHALTGPVWAALPLAGFDFVHIGLIAAVAALALAPGGRSADSPWPGSAGERWRAAAWLGGGLIVLTTATQLAVLGEWRALWTGLPLALAILTAAVVRVPAAADRAAPRSRLRPVWIFLALLGGGLLLRLPEAIRARDFEQLVGRGIAALSSGDIAVARAQLTAALDRRPGHADVRWLLGWAELQAGDRSSARAHLEAAVAGRPASVEATRYLALLDLLEGRRDDAVALLDRRRARHPESADLAYLAWVAAEAQPLRGEAPAPVVANANAAEIREIFALARVLGDAATLQACIRRDRETSGASRP
ncbi:MAG: tetratricopeptide repeat protein [Thermoanaerobaculia bacterium]|nr:tetratricopeptide repeat protein [Thermoanaerobaculia bacterium]